MDYLFIAGNSICLGFDLLLLFWHLQRKRSGLLFRHFLIALGTVFLYYTLDVNVFSLVLPLYYLMNVLPPILLLGMLFYLLWPHRM